jgi:hypothetical protein
MSHEPFQTVNGEPIRQLDRGNLTEEQWQAMQLADQRRLAYGLEPQKPNAKFRQEMRPIPQPCCPTCGQILPHG